jgi:hypothetical protein
MSDRIAMSESFDDQSLQFSVLASTLGIENRESADLLEYLAEKLETAIPSHTEVVRKSGFFSRKQSVEKIVVEFDDAIYTLVRTKHGAPAASIGKKSRGIILKTSDTPVAAWTNGLAEELCRMSEQSIETRDALQKLITG